MTAALLCFQDFFLHAFPFFLCYGTAALVGFGVALIELLSRYGSGNNPKWVMYGKPQSIYYSINSLAAIVTLFIAESTGATAILVQFSTNAGLAIIKSAEIGIAAMFALRSSLYSVEKSDKKSKVDLGPAQILNVLNRYLDRQMDQNRGAAAMSEVSDIMVGFDANLFDLGAICLAVPEAIPDEDIVRIRKSIDSVRRSKDFTPAVAALVVGLQLQREIGADNLRAAVKALRANVAKEAGGPGSSSLDRAVPQPSPPSPTAHESVRTSEGMVSSEEQVDEELTAIYKEFSSGISPAGGKDGGEQ